MKHLLRLVQSSAPSTSVQFRKSAYGRRGVQEFLRDVLAMANASVDGSRYIITGVQFDDKGRKCLYPVAADDFEDRPAYQTLVNDHIEPPLKINYQPVLIDGERIGVFEIGDCQDRPYMMRIDFSETLRRGDAYARINDTSMKLGRRQLQTLFERQFSNSVSATNVEIGFPGNIIHKSRKLATQSLRQLPSLLASEKLNELIEAKTRVQASAGNTMMARLTHARLFGSDVPYEDRSTEEIRAEIQQLERRYRDHDEQFLFTEKHTDLQLVILNQGGESIHDAALNLVMPTHHELYIATCLPKVFEAEKFIERTAEEQADYPSVTLRDNQVQVCARFAEIPAGELINVFTLPLRVCVGEALKGRRLGIQYKLLARNLRAPAAGTLRLLLT
ncbi:MAG: ATP-binding protein [Gammaproteobacteria bacterium]|nr:ATP-binding protein [Gammaproteobacteria bacterium]MDH5304768.1 ATP-binding protein [Gammaproteobacteria bacterium]MDH5322401.1 ATP-binding protein [Gammaproteobacteria bacterium]